MNVSVRELKSHLSEYLRRVGNGQRFVVTDRGRPVAELGPAGRADLTIEQRMSAMAEAGEVTLSRGKGLRPFRPARVRGRPVSATLLEERR
jgi:prevent-host-death family protein